MQKTLADYEKQVYELFDSLNTTNSLFKIAEQWYEESNRLGKVVSEKFAEALEEVKRIIDRMDIDIFDNESVGKDAYYQIHTSINEAKRQINEVISKFSR